MSTPIGSAQKAKSDGQRLLEQFSARKKSQIKSPALRGSVSPKRSEAKKSHSVSPKRADAIAAGQQLAQLYSASKHRSDKGAGSSMVSPMPAPAFYATGFTPDNEEEETPMSVSELIQRAIYEVSHKHSDNSQTSSSSTGSSSTSSTAASMNEMVQLLQQIQQRVDADVQERTSPKRHIQFASPASTPSSDSKRHRLHDLDRSPVPPAGSSSSTAANTAQAGQSGYDRHVMDQYMNNQLDLNANETQYYNDKIEELLGLLDDREAELETASKTLSQKDEELKFAKQELAQYMNNQLDLQSTETATFEDQILTLSNALDEKDVEVEDLQTSLAQKTAKGEEQEAQLQTLEQRLKENTAAYQQELDQFKQQLATLDAELQESRAATESKSVEVASLEAANIGLRSELDQLRAESEALLAKKDEESVAALQEAEEKHKEALDALRWEMDDDKSEIESLKQQISEVEFRAEKQVEELKQQVAQLEDRILGLSDEHDQRKLALEASIAECDSLSRSLQTVEHRAAQLEADLSTATVDLSSAKTDCQTAQARLSEAEAAASAAAVTAAEDVASLHEALVAANALVEQRESDIHNTQTELATLQTALGQAEEQGQAQVRALEDRLQAAEEAAEMERKAAETDLAASQQLLEQLQSEMTAVDDHNQSLTQEVTLLQTKCSELTGAAGDAAGAALEIASLKDAVSQKELELQCAADVAAKQQKNITELYQQQLQQTQQEITVQQEQIAELSSKLYAHSSTAAASDATSADLRKALNQKEEELKKSKQESAQYMQNQLDLQKTEMATFEDQILTLSNALDEKDVEVEELQTSLAQKEEALASVRQELAQYMQNQLDLQSTETATYEQQIESLTSDLAKKDEESVAALQEAEEKHKEALDVLRWEMDDDKSEIESLKQQISEVELRAEKQVEENDQRKVALEASMTECDSLSRSLQAVEHRAAQLEADLSTAQQLNKQTGSQVQVELQALRVSSEAAALEFRQREADLSTRLASSASEVEVLQSELAATQSYYEQELQRQAEELRRELTDHTEEETERLQQTIAMLEEQVSDWQRQAATAQEEVVNAQNNVSDLQEQVMIQDQTLQRQVAEIYQLQSAATASAAAGVLQSSSTPAVKNVGAATPGTTHGQRRALFAGTPQSEIRKLQKVIQAAASTTPRRKHSKPATPTSRNPFDMSADVPAAVMHSGDAVSRTAQLDVYMSNQLDLNESESNYYSEVIDQLVEQMETLQGTVETLTQENINLKQTRARSLSASLGSGGISLSNSLSSIPNSPHELNRSQSGLSLMEVSELQRSQQEAQERYNDQCIVVQQLENEKSAAELAMQQLQSQLDQLQSQVQSQGQVQSQPASATSSPRSGSASAAGSAAASVTSTPLRNSALFQQQQSPKREGGLVFDADFENFVKEAREMEEKFSTAQASIEELTAQVAELQQINEQLEAANGEWNDYFATAQEQEEKSAAEIAELTQQIAELQAGNGSSEATEARHSEMMAALREQVSELQTLNDELKTAAAETEATDKQTVAALREQVSELQTLNDELKTAAAEGAEAVSTSDAADKAAIEELKAQVAELQQINEQLEAANGEWNEYYINTQSDLETLSADVAQKSEEIAVLTQNCEELKVNPAEASVGIRAREMAQAVADLEAQLADKEQEVRELLTRVEQAEAEAEASGAGVSEAPETEWRERVAALEAQLADSQEELSAVQEANEQYQIEYNAVVQQNDEIKTLNNETVDQYARLKAEFEASSGGGGGGGGGGVLSLSHMNASGTNTSVNASTSAHVHTLESEKDELQLSMTITRRERDEALMEVEQLRSRVASKDSRIEKLLADMQKQQHQYRNEKFHAMEAASHSHSFANNSMNVSTMSASITNTPRATDAQRRVQHLEIENNSLRSSLEEKVRELETEHHTNVYLRQLVENIETSEETVVQLQQEKADLFEQLKSSEEAVRQGSIKLKGTQDQYDTVVADLQLRVAHSRASVESYESRVAVLEKQLQTYQSQISSLLSGGNDITGDMTETGGDFDLDGSPDSSAIHQLHSKMQMVAAEKCAVEKACHDYKLEVLNLEELLGQSKTHAAALDKYLQTLGKHVSLVQGSISKQQDTLYRQVEIWMTKFDERLLACKEKVTAASEHVIKTSREQRESSAHLQEELHSARQQCAQEVQERRDVLVQLNHAEHMVAELEQTVSQYKNKLSSPSSASVNNRSVNLSGVSSGGGHNSSRSIIQDVGHNHANDGSDHSDDDDFDIVQGLFASPLRGDRDHDRDGSRPGSGAGAGTGSASATKHMRSRRLRDQLEQAEKRLQDMSAENARSYAEQSHRIIFLENENRHLQSVTDELKQSNEQLLEEIQAAGEGLNQSVLLQTQHDSLAQEVEQLRIKLDESAENFASREAALQAEIQSLQFDNNKQVRGLEFEIQEHQLKASALEQQVAQQQQEMKASGAQMAESQSFYTALLAEKDVQAQKLSTALAAAKTRTTEREQELSVLQARVHEVELQHNEVSLQLASLQSAFDQEKRAHVQKTDAMTQEAQAHLQEQLNLIENTVVAQLRLQLSHLAHEKQLLEQQLVSQGHDLTHFQQDSKDLDSMRKQMGVVSEASHQNELRLAAVTRECDAVKAQFKEFQNTTHAAVCASLEEAQNTARDLTEALERSRSSHVLEVQELSSKHSAQVDTLTSDYELAKQELSIATNKVFVLQTTVSTLEEEARFSHQSLEELQARVEEFNEQESVSHEQIVEYERDLSVQRARVRELETEVQKRTAAVAEMTAKESRLCADMRSMVMQLSTAMAAYTGSSVGNDLFATPVPGDSDSGSASHASGRDSTGSSIFEAEGDSHSEDEGHDASASVSVSVSGSSSSGDAGSRTTRKLFNTTRLRIEKLIAHHNALQKRCTALVTEVSEGKSKLHKTELQVESVRKQLKEKESKCQDLNSRLEAKETELKKLLAAAEAEQKINDKSYHETLSALQDVIDEVSETVATVNSDIHNLAGLTAFDRIPGMDVQGLVIYNVDSNATQILNRVNDFKQHVHVTLSGICSTVHKLTTDINAKTSAASRASSQHKDALGKLEDERSSLQSELSMLKETHQRLVEQSDSHKEELDTLRSENKKLQIVCNEFSQNNAELQHELSHASDTASSLKYQMEDADNVCSNLKQHVERLQEDVNTKTKEVTAAKAHSNALQQQLYVKDTDLEKNSIVCKRLIVEKDMLEASNAKHAAEVDQLKRDLGAKNTSLKEENSRMKLEQDKVLHAINLTIEYYKISSSSASGASASATAASASSSTSESAADKHKLVMEKLALIQSTNKALSNSKYSLENREKLLEQEIGSLRTKLAAVTGEQNESHKLVVTELKKQVTEIQKRNAESVAEIQSLQSTNNELVSALSREKQQSSSNSNKYDLAIQTKDAECARLKSELDSKIRNLDLQREQMVISNDRNKALLAASEGFQQKLTVVTTTKEQLEGKVKALESTLEKTQTDLSSLQERFQREAVDMKQELISKAANEKKEYNLELERYKHECAGLKKEVQVQQQAVFALQTDKATSNRSLVTLQAQVTEHQAKVQALMSEVTQFKSEQLASAARLEEELNHRRQLETALQQQTATVTALRKQSLESSSSSSSTVNNSTLVQSNTTSIQANTMSTNNNVRLIQELQQQVRKLEEDVSQSQAAASHLKSLEQEVVTAREELAVANRKASGFRKEGRTARQQVFDLTDRLRENINVFRSQLNITTGMAFVTPAHPHSGGDMQQQSLSEALGIPELTSALHALDSMVPFITGHGSANVNGAAANSNSNNGGLSTPVAHRFSQDGGSVVLQRLEDENARMSRVLSEMETSHSERVKTLTVEKTQLETRLSQANRETVSVNQKLLKQTSHINEQLDQLQQEKTLRLEASAEIAELRRSLKILSQERDELRNRASLVDSLTKEKGGLERDLRLLGEEKDEVYQELLAANHHRNILKNTVEKLEGVLLRKQEVEDSGYSYNASGAGAGTGSGVSLDTSLLLQDISIIGESSSAVANTEIVHSLKKQLVIARYKISSLSEVVQLYHNSVVALYPDGNTYGAAQHSHFHGQSHSQSRTHSRNISGVGGWIEEELSVVKASYAAELRYYELEVADLRTKYSSELAYVNELRKQFEQTLRNQYSHMSDKSTSSSTPVSSESSRLNVLSQMLDRNESKISELMSSLNTERSNARHRQSQLVSELNRSLRTQDNHVSTIKHLEDVCIQNGIDYVMKHRGTGTGTGTDIRVDYSSSSSVSQYSKSPFKTQQQQQQRLESNRSSSQPATPAPGAAPGAATPTPTPTPTPTAAAAYTSSTSTSTPPQSVIRRASPLTSRTNTVDVTTGAASSISSGITTASYSARHTTSHTGTGISIDSGKGFLSKSSSLPIYQPQTHVHVTAQQALGHTQSQTQSQTLVSAAVRLGANSSAGTGVRPLTTAPNFGSRASSSNSSSNNSSNNRSSRSGTPTSAYYRPPSAGTGNTPQKVDITRDPTPTAVTTAIATSTTATSSSTSSSTTASSSSRNLASVSQGTGVLRAVSSRESRENRDHSRR